MIELRWLESSTWRCESVAGIDGEHQAVASGEPALQFRIPGSTEADFQWRDVPTVRADYTKKPQVTQQVTQDLCDAPLTPAAKAYMARMFPCTKPCDSMGVCEGCCENILFLAGYNFGYRADLPYSSSRPIKPKKRTASCESIGSKHSWKTCNGSTTYCTDCDELPTLDP